MDRQITLTLSIPEIRIVGFGLNQIIYSMQDALRHPPADVPLGTAAREQIERRLATAVEVLDAIDRTGILDELGMRRAQ